MKKLLLFAAILLSTQSAFASETIKSRQYSYGYDELATAMTSETYLTCEKCPDDNWAKMERPITISFSNIKNKEVKPEKETASLLMGQLSGQENKKEKLQTQKQSILLGTIYFDLDSARLKVSESKRLKEMGHAASNSAVTVGGYTCSLGSQKHNISLSWRRAEAVAERLKAVGVNVANIKGEGESNPVSPIKEKNRRVEIRSLGEGTADVSETRM